MENHIACLSRLLQNYSMFNGNNVLLFFFHSDDAIDSGDSMEEDDHDSYENRLARLREKHGGTLADFKLKCWAKMLVSLDIKKISFGKIEKINPIFEFGSSKTTYFKSMCVHLLF